MRIFVGYPSERRNVAEEVVAFVQSLGHEAWFDRESLDGGDVWDSVRSEAQNSADFIIHLFAPEMGTRKGVVWREIRHTLRLAEDQPLGRTFLTFLRLEGARMPAELLHLHYIDFDPTRWRDRLARSLDKATAALHSDAPQAPVGLQTDRQTSMMKRIEFTDTTDVYDCAGDYIQYEADGDLYLTFVNGRLASECLESYFSYRSDFSDFDPPSRPDMRSEWQYRSQEFYRGKSVISIRTACYFYWSGAAHPNHYVRTYNFAGPEYGSLAIESILANDETSARRLLKYCETVILAQIASDNPDEPAPVNWFGNYDTNVEDVWKLLGQFNIDTKGLTINFSPYDVLPYVFGSQETFVPWSVLSSMMAPRYRSLMESLSE